MHSFDALCENVQCTVNSHGNEENAINEFGLVWFIYGYGKTEKAIQGITCKSVNTYFQHGP